mmetsp:Transcript_1265/g.1788  ORF Transcript_1265/g.1788 Transcript_1265/m.1788 type:complete len:114 (-) Transcript_1265:107-448(-)
MGGHDQLPDAEELKTDSKTSSRRICTCPVMVGGICLVLAAVIGLGTFIGTVVRKSEMEQSELDITLETLRLYSEDASFLEDEHSPLNEEPLNGVLLRMLSKWTATRTSFRDTP